MNDFFTSQYSLHHYVKDGDRATIGDRIKKVMGGDFAPGDPLKPVSGVFTGLLYNNGSCPYNLTELQKDGMRYYPGDHVLFFCDYYIWTLYRGKLSAYSNANAPVRERGIIEKAETLWSWFYPYRDFLNESELGRLSQLLMQDCYPLPFILAKGRKHINKESIGVLRKSSDNNFASYFLNLAFLCTGGDLTNINSKDRLYLRDGKHARLLYDYFTPNAIARIINKDLAAQAVDQANQYDSLVNNVECALHHWNSMKEIPLVRDNFPLPRTFKGINAIKRAHALAEEIYEAAQKMRSREELKRNKERGRIYKWPEKLTACMTGGWNLFRAPIELSIRGKKHHNCVGSYAERMFGRREKLKFRSDVLSLLIYNKEATAELSFKVLEDKITDCRLVQCKTKYNKDYDKAAPVRILIDIQKTCQRTDLLPCKTRRYVDLEKAGAGL